MSHDPVTPGEEPGPRAWTELGHRRGVRLRCLGEGRPIVVLPGMEGSGESCLHLVLPVVAPDAPTDGVVPPSLGRVILVDYGRERHRFLGELVATIAELLTEATDPAEPVVWWGQSFGNLLAAQVRQQAGLFTRCAILVSPFTGLSPGRVLAARMALSVTPRALYAKSATPGGRLLFGPAPDDTGAAFFRALAAMGPEDVRRRVGWLAGQDFASPFLGIGEPVGVWLGERDRLVDLPRQLAFFSALARRDGDRLTVLAGSGHVVLPPGPVEVARAGLREMLAAQG